MRQDSVDCCDCSGHSKHQHQRQLMDVLAGKEKDGVTWMKRGGWHKEDTVCGETWWIVVIAMATQTPEENPGCTDWEREGWSDFHKINKWTWTHFLTSTISIDWQWYSSTLQWYPWLRQWLGNKMMNQCMVFILCLCLLILETHWVHSITNQFGWASCTNLFDHITWQPQWMHTNKWKSFIIYLQMITKSCTSAGGKPSKSPNTITKGATPEKEGGDHHIGHEVWLQGPPLCICH